MQQGWNEADESNWEKIRLLAYFTANSQFFRPIKRIESILKLPTIDLDDADKWDEIRNKLLQKREALLRV